MIIKILGDKGGAGISFSIFAKKNMSPNVIDKNYLDLKDAKNKFSIK